MRWSIVACVCKHRKTKSWLPVCSWRCSLTIWVSSLAATTNGRHGRRWSSPSPESVGHAPLSELCGENAFRAAQAGTASGGHWHQQVRGPLLWKIATSLLTHDGSTVSLVLISLAALKSHVRSAVGFQPSATACGASESGTPSFKGQV